MFRKKSTAPPTHEERIARANKVAGNAVTVFHQAAEDLEAAAAVHSDVALSVDAEIQQRQADFELAKSAHEAEVMRLSDLADGADDQAAEHRLAAERIRALFA